MAPGRCGDFVVHHARQPQNQTFGFVLIEKELRKSVNFIARYVSAHCGASIAIPSGCFLYRL